MKIRMPAIVIPVLVCMFYAVCVRAAPPGQGGEPAVKPAPAVNKSLVGTWLRQVIHAGSQTLPPGDATMVLTDKNTFLSMSDHGVSEGKFKVEGDKMTMTVTGGLAAGTKATHQYKVSADGRMLTFTYEREGVRVSEVYKRKS